MSTHSYNTRTSDKQVKKNRRNNKSSDIVKSRWLARAAGLLRLTLFFSLCLSQTKAQMNPQRQYTHDPEYALQTKLHKLHISIL